MSDLVARRANIRRARPVKWLWPGHLVKDNFNLIVGNEGVGKSTLAAWVLAKLTAGKLDGSEMAEPVNVGIIGNEDDFDQVWTPKAHVCGGDLNRLNSIKRSDFDQIDIHRDIADLRELVGELDLKVLFFDQLLDNLAAETDHYHAKQVRSAIVPFAAVAKEIGVTVLATLHPNKRAETFRQLVQGTSAFNAVARSTLYVSEHPEDPDLRVVLTAKSNLGRKGYAHEFKILPMDERVNGYRLKTAKVVGMRRSTVELDELIEVSMHGRRRDGGRVSEMGNAIRGFLEDGEWHPSAELYDFCGRLGFQNEKGIRNRCQKLGVEYRKAGFSGPWECRLPSKSQM